MRNLIERAYILSSREEIGAENFPVAVADKSHDMALPRGIDRTFQLPTPTSMGATFDLTGVLEQTEKDLILRMLSTTAGAQAEAARRMGLSRSALAYKLNKYGIRASVEG